MDNNIHEAEGETVSHHHRRAGNNNFLAISILIAALLISGSVIYAFKDKSTTGKVPKTQFASCVTTRKYKSTVEEHTANARTAGIQGTPSTFVNGYFINGAQPWEEFKSAIDDALAGKKSPAQTGAPKPEPIGSGDVILGDANAPVTVIEYGDYQCPFCSRFFMEIEPLLRDQYIKNGKVKMVFRNFPFLGPESIAAAEAAECSKDEGKFWAFHDAIYTAEHQDGQERNGNLNNDLFFKIASELKLK